MDVDTFIHDTGLKMDRPIHLGRRISDWATGILESDSYDRWYAVLEVNGEEIQAYWHSSIRQCSDCYIPGLIDFLEEVQSLLIWSRAEFRDDHYDGISIREALEAFTAQQVSDLIDMDVRGRRSHHVA